MRSVISRPSPRERTLNAMVSLTSSEGYGNVTIAQITHAASVSRTTFYEHFADKEQCFLAVHGDIAERLATEVEQALAQSEPSQALASAIAALVAFAAREPPEFNLVMHEALIAGALTRGARPRQARDRLIDRLEKAIQTAEAAFENMKAADRTMPEATRADRSAMLAATNVVDMPIRLALGAAIRLIGISMRRADGLLEPSLAALPSWLTFYELPSSRARWQTLASEIPGPGLVDPSRGPVPQPPLQRGMQDDGAADVQRDRILYATADAVCGRGYPDMTVTEIAASAGVTREVFYNRFKDKREALLQTQRLVFEQMIAASAGAFFTEGSPWHERVWEAISATVGWIVRQPTLAHFEFIGGYASGPSDARRLDENLLGFLVFLDEGERYHRKSPEVPRVAREAIACAVVELLGHCIRHYRSTQIPELKPLLAYLILAPFLGPAQTNDLIDAKQREADA
jgi:AcrR family transcriptional regulator